MMTMYLSVYYLSIYYLSIYMCGSRFHHVQILQRKRRESWKEMKALKQSCLPNMEDKSLMKW